MKDQGMELTVERHTITPMALLVTAQEKGASLEQMQQLLDLQERWEAREAQKAYNEAISLFREACPTIDRSRRGHNTRYAGLAETLEAIRPLLAKFGLSHQWKTHQKDGNITVQCTVMHRLGHSESTSLTAEPDKTGSKNSIQAIGSTVAYLERYTLYAILGLASREMDDDGQGAGAKEPTLDDEQLANLDALIAETGADLAKFCTFMQVNSLANIPAKKYAYAVQKLEAKRGK